MRMSPEAHILKYLVPTGETIWEVLGGMALLESA